MQVPVKPVGKRMLRSLLAGMLALLGVARVNLVPRANLMTSNVNEKSGFIFWRRSVRARSPST